MCNYLFFQLLNDDQIRLLKSSCLEVMILRTALRYDRITGSIIFRNGLHLNHFYFATDMVDQDDTLLRPLFNLSVSLARVFLDDAEIALMMGLLLLSGKCHKRKLDKTHLERSDESFFWPINFLCDEYYRKKL